MNVKRRMQIMMILPIVLALAISVILAWLTTRIDRIVVQLRAVNAITRDAVLLERLTYAYLRDPSPGSQEQWQANRDRLAKTIAQESGANPSDQDVFQDLGRVLDNASAAFAELAAQITRGEPATAEPVLKQFNLLRAYSQIIAEHAMVLAAKGHDQTTAIQSAAFMLVIGISSVLALLLAAIALLVSRHIAQGLALLQEGTHRVAEGKLGHTIPLAGRDELGELAAAFNRMSRELKKDQESLRAEIMERKKVSESLRQSNIQLADALNRLQRAQEEVIQQERSKVLKQMADGILHDIYDALMPILGYSEMILRDPQYLNNPKDLQESLQIIHRAAAQASSVARHLSDYFYPTQRENAAPASINAACESALATVLPSWKEGGHGIRVKTEWGILPQFNTIAEDLDEALIQIISNATEAMAGVGTLTVKTVLDEDQAVIEIRDTGPGMDGVSCRRCLEPFYSTKGHGHSGMGLAIAQGAITRCQGKLAIESLPGKGTTVTIRLPNIHGDQADVRIVAEPLTSRKLSILVVDDEIWIRQVLARMLQTKGHAVEVAADGQTALALFRARPFDLVIVDLAMPTMNGNEIAVVIKQIRPKTPVIMLTGYGDMIAESGAKPPAVDFLLGKPMTLDDIHKAIAHVIG